MGHSPQRTNRRLRPANQGEFHRRYNFVIPYASLPGAPPLMFFLCVHKGNKRDNVTVIYTPWSNLKKDGSMAVGQVGFHVQKQVCVADPSKKG